jgi:hypothetical protein
LIRNFAFRTYMHSPNHVHNFCLNLLRHAIRSSQLVFLDKKSNTDFCNKIHARFFFFFFFFLKSQET